MKALCSWSIGSTFLEYFRDPVSIMALRIAHIQKTTYAEVQPLSLMLQKCDTTIFTRSKLTAEIELINYNFLFTITDRNNLIAYNTNTN